MKIKTLIVAVIIITAAGMHCNAGIVYDVQLKKYERSLFGKSIGNKREKKIRESRKVVKAKNEQAKNETKLERDYARYIKESRKRSVEIQTPEVQERMKQNNKQTISKNREKRKASDAITKKAGRKYGN